MNDTAPWAAEKVAELLRQRTPAERVAMASAMFTNARALMAAGLRAQYPGITDTELTARIFERTYRADFAPEAWSRLWEQMRARVFPES